MEQDKAFEELRKATSHKLQRLEEKNQLLQDELRLERERYQKAQQELSEQRKRLIMECKICYKQPDRWMTILCGHMICESCAGNLETPKKCPVCRSIFAGYVGCYPFAG
jgi:rubrerythrin